MSLEIRLIKNSEYIEVNDFFNSTRNISGPAKKISRGFTQFDWEFFRGPDRQAIYAGAWEVEERNEPIIIGIQCLIVHKMYSSEGKYLLAAKGEDAIIDINALIKFRETDILKELSVLLIVECKKIGVEFLWGFNNLPATYRRLGFETPFKSYNRVLILNPVKAFSNIKILRAEHTTSGKVNIAILSVLSFLFSLKKIFILTRKQGFHINFGIDENKNLFQRAVLPERLLFLLQDEKFLQWRILGNPYPVEYKSFQLLDHDNILQAQVIYSVSNKTAFIEQMLFDKKLDRKVVNFLLKRVLKSLKNDKIILVRFTGYKNNSINRREICLMKNLGFVLTGNGEWFTFKKLSDTIVITPEEIFFSRLYKQGRT